MTACLSYEKSNIDLLKVEWWVY